MTGSREQLDASPITEGAIYFIPSTTGGPGDVAYDFNGCRSWVSNPRIVTYRDLEALDNYIPRVGEIIIVKDAFITEEYTPTETIIHHCPGLKIGNGETSAKYLEYTDEYSRINFNKLQQNIVEDLNNLTTTAEYTPAGIVKLNEETDPLNVATVDGHQLVLLDNIQATFEGALSTITSTSTYGENQPSETSKVKVDYL